MKPSSSPPVRAVVADPNDRFLAPIDPWLRYAKHRFTALVIVVCLLHGSFLAFLLARDHSTPQVPPNEIPVEVVVVPPPPPPQPKKEEPKPQPKQKPHYEKPATDAPPPPNNEKVQRENNANESASPTPAKPTPSTETKPTPDKPVTASQNAVPEPAERTAAPDTPEEKADAEALSKAAPMKDPKPTQKAKPAKEKAPLPSHQSVALAREFAALTQSPNFAIAAPAKPSPVSGGHCDTNTYLCTLYALIMRQQHYPASARAQHIEGKVVVAFWLDERGDLTHQAVYRTSGHPELDAEAVAAIHRAAPFPPPPPGSPHGFVASMAFPPK